MQATPKSASLSRLKIAALLASLAFGFFQEVTFLPTSLAQSPSPAQAPGVQPSAPVDIQANEQEFADDQVIAKGNVKVTYKDSIIYAPLARLFRDPAGQPQKAVFVGHPHLTQKESKINADTLIFEIATSKVVAQGHAHSEVNSEGDTNTAPSPTTNNPKKSKSKPAQKMVGGKPVINWPKVSDDQDANLATTAPAGEEGTKNTASLLADNNESANSENNDSSNNKSNNKSTSSSASELKKKEQSKTAPPEKIITDSDTQEYDKSSGKFDADGHVHVVHGEISVFADKLQLVYGIDNKPETALFTGHVNAFQNTNNTQSDMMTYYLSTKRLQATGNVRSKMIQKPLDNKKPGDGKTIDKKAISSNPSSNAGAANATVSGVKKAEESTILILSDAQDYSQNTGRMAADGNVKVYYEDTVGVGPKALLFRNAQGKTEKVIFNGRSQITQPGKRWIADRITFTVANKKVLAEGNTKAFIIRNDANGKDPSNGSALASKPGNAGSHTMIAEKSNLNNSGAKHNEDTNARAVSTSKVEVVR